MTDPRAMDRPRGRAGMDTSSACANDGTVSQEAGCVLEKHKELVKRGSLDTEPRGECGPANQAVSQL